MATDIETIAQHYRILLNREMNSDEIVGCEKMLRDSTSSQFQVDAFRSSMIKSKEFLNVNRELFYGSLFPKSTVVLAKTPLGQDIYVDMRELHLGGAIAQGVFEPSETAFIVKTIKRGFHVCDVGANVGYFSLMFGALAGNSGKVWAFEPVSQIFGRLKSAITINKLDGVVHAFNNAVSNTNDQLYIECDLDSLNSGASHLTTETQGSNNKVVEMVESVRLDDILLNQKVDFIKMDVEGAELLVLQGALNTLKRNKPQMLIEFNQNQLRSISSIDALDLAEYICQIGYKLHTIDANGDLIPISDLKNGLPRFLEKTGIFNAVAIPIKNS